MIEVLIRRLGETASEESDRHQIREIFFRTSARQDFKNESEKSKFFSNWTDHYFRSHPDLVFIACGPENPESVWGYLTGCDDSVSALSFFETHVTSYSLFLDQFQKFPAHLHINCHPEHQGKGIGTKLINRFLAELAQRKSPGVHIVTSGESRNINFYKRLGFDHEIERDFGGSRLRFMGLRF